MITLTAHRARAASAARRAGPATRRRARQAMPRAAEQRKQAQAEHDGIDRHGIARDETRQRRRDEAA